MVIKILGKVGVIGENGWQGGSKGGRESNTFLSGEKVVETEPAGQPLPLYCGELMMKTSEVLSAGVWASTRPAREQTRYRMPRIFLTERAVSKERSWTMALSY